MSDRVQEWNTAQSLVCILLSRHGLDALVQVDEVLLLDNYKVTFTFTLCGEPPGKSRFGRRPGLEMEWKKCKGDVDAWSPAGGDLAAFFGHAAQVVREELGFNAEKPSRLLTALLES